MEQIGQARGELKAIVARFGLAPLRGVIPSAWFEFAARRAGCAAKRASPLQPESTFWLMVLAALDGTSMTAGLKTAWALIGRAFPCWAGARAVSEEAFCRARERLSVRFWRTVWQMLWTQYQDRLASQLVWKEWRVFAVDGTTVALPKHPRVSARFKHQRKGRGGTHAPQGRLVALCSVFTGFCANFAFMPLRFSEHEALRHLIRGLYPGDLVLLDRGFFSL